MSLARLGQTEHADALTALLDDPDPLVAHTAVRALQSLHADAACFAVLDRSEANPAERLGAIRVLQSLHETDVVDGLIQRLECEEVPARRMELLAALCRLHDREGNWKGDSWGTRPDTSGPYYQPEPWKATPRITQALKAALEQASGAEAAFLFNELNRHKIRIESSLETIVAMASKDPTVIPAAVGQLARGKTIPPNAIPLLVRVASASETEEAVRSQAVVSLARTDSDAAVRSMLTALSLLDKAEVGHRDAQQAQDAFVRSLGIGNHLKTLESVAEESGPEAVWADAALLALADDPRRSPEVRALAAKRIEEGWKNPQHRVQILKAVTRSRCKTAAELVLAALDDPDEAVSLAAREAAKALKIDRKPKPSQSTGPRIASLKLAEVLGSVVPRRGDPELGEQLFTRLNCVNCHTVRKEEPLRGPFLGNIAATYKRPELAEAILMPSKSLAQGFVTNLFALDDGTTISGFVVQEAANSVTIRTSEGKEVQIPTATIEERAKSDVSVMPEGLLNEITVEEFASLLDYLQSLSDAQ